MKDVQQVRVLINKNKLNKLNKKTKISYLFNDLLDIYFNLDSLNKVKLNRVIYKLQQKKEQGLYEENILDNFK